MKKELALEVYRHFCHHSRPERTKLNSIPRFPAKKKVSFNRKHPYAYYNQFKPAIYVLRLCGRYPLQVSNQGEYSSKWLSWSMAYCIITYGLQTYVAIIVCFRRVQALVDSQSDYDEFIFSIHVLAYLQIHFHVPFTYWIQASKLADYLKKWATFQEDWESTFGQPLTLAYQKTVVVYVSLVIPAILLLLVFEQYSTLHDPILYFLPYFMTITSSAIILGLWYFTCLEIKRIAKELSSILAERLNSKPTPWMLSKWRLLWIDLRSLSESLGTDLCAVLMSIMLTFSTTFLLGVYNGLVELISYSFTLKAFGYLSASTLSLVVIFAVCDGGHKATSGVVSSTLISLLKRKLPLFNQEILHEIFLILESIKADPPEIKLGGFVTLNRPLVVSLISNTLTYLIVLLQFKVNEK